ncbi:hypothetical protein OESDEN_12762 [Oesophagostomum dentatum]|uniref:GAF domain-containing protein n=1 Tax=Oesophagostomum dentatum TaxID=61180 RepID=A0A0B1SW82_OESDE|nr:hypothetical protein OESDEN_12762 [Oesophagostomum dentatum]
MPAVRILYELAQCCAQVANTDLCELVIQNEEGVFLVYKDRDSNDEHQIKCRKVKRARRNPMHLQKLIDVNEGNIGEIHFNSPVSERDRQIINVICTWAGGSLHYAQVATQLERTGSSSELFTRQRRLNQFLLDVAKSIFQDIVSMDTVIIKVMNFAAKLVDADRASLFLVDNKNHELYARIFDVGKGGEELEKINRDGHKEIRFSMSRGIAGHVASTGEGLNIENAYEDTRFNPEVDSKTGYTTKTILCMPIFIRGRSVLYYLWQKPQTA